MSSIPQEISTPWNDLLKNRVLLHQTKKVVGEISEFERLLQSPRLEDQNQVAAIESYANRTFNLVIDMTKALLISRSEEDSAVLKDSIDKVLTILQAGFSKGGLQLEMDFPPEFLSDDRKPRD
jgi:hypothetical protein